MHQRIKILMCALVIFLVSLGQRAFSENLFETSLSSKRILVLYTYHYNQGAQKKIAEGLEKAREIAGLETLGFVHEFLDLAQIRNNDHRVRLTDFLMSKYRDRNFDLVITVFNEALSFLMDDLSELSPDSPVLALYAQKRPSFQRNGHDVFQSPLYFDPKGTLKLALTLFPDTRSVLFITGNSRLDREFETKARTEFAVLPEKLSVSYTSQMTLDGIIKQVSGLFPGTLVIYGRVSGDIGGKTYDARDVAIRLSRAARVPVFCLATSHLDTGTVGGSMVDVERLSEMLGRRLPSILGSSPVPPDPASHFVMPMVNWDQIKRWDIDPGKIPSGTLIINRPDTVWDNYGNWIIATVIVTCVLTAFLMILAVKNHRLRQVETSLTTSERKYRSLFENMLDAFAHVRLVYEFDKIVDFEFVEVNPAHQRLTGFSHVEGKRIRELIPGLGEEISELFDIFTRVAATGQAEKFETYLPSIGAWFSVSAYRLEEDNLVILFSNITTRKKAEEDLTMFKHLVEHSTDAIGISTPDGKHYYQNKAFDRLFGDAGENPVESVYVDKTLGRTVFDTIMGGGIYQGEIQLYDSSGGIRDVFLRAYAIFNKEGEIVGITGLHNDITDQKKTEKELAEWMRRYELIVEASGQVAYEYTVATGNITWGSSITRVLGYDPTESEGGFAQWTDWLHPDDKDAILAQLSEAERDCAYWDAKYRLRHKTGVYVWIRDRGFFVSDESGKSYCQLGMLENITEAKAIEDELNFRNSLLAAQQETSIDGILVVDHAGKVLSFNKRFSEIWDIPPETLATGIDEHLLQIAKTKVVDSDEFLKKVRDLYKDPVRTSQDEILFVDGRVLDRYSAPISDAGGRYYGRVWYFHEITHRKTAEEEKLKLQEQLHQSRKMEYVGRLAGGVAHDFNNMLGVILGHLDMIMVEMSPSDPIYDELIEIKKAGERSADLTRQLLTFARKQISSPVVLDMNETVGGMLRMLGRLIGEDIELRWSPGQDLLPVKIDPSQVDQLLVNLCLNARDAIDGVGKISIETQVVLVEEKGLGIEKDCAPGPYVLIEVSDTGRGMEKEVCERIFEPFFTTKAVGQGTGLGLATVYGIVKQNNGVIHVYSEPGRGSSFKIYLPAGGTLHTPKTHEDAEEETQPGSETILLVEDEAAILKMATLMLEQKGYTVLAASRPEEALNMARAYDGTIDLLMTDVIMPGMNGRDLAETIAGLYPGLKCLFMSGYTSDVISHHGVLDEGVHFVQKPFSMKSLGSKLREVFKKP